jgi:hypothetical protein
MCWLLIAFLKYASVFTVFERHQSCECDLANGANMCDGRREKVENVCVAPSWHSCRQHGSVPRGLCPACCDVSSAELGRGAHDAIQHYHWHLGGPFNGVYMGQGGVLQSMHWLLCVMVAPPSSSLRLGGCVVCNTGNVAM